MSEVNVLNRESLSSNNGESDATEVSDDNKWSNFPPFQPTIDQTEKAGEIPKKFEVRNLSPEDDLEKAAELIYQVDPYICPDFFGDKERAAKFGEVLFNSENGLFSFSHTFVAEDINNPGKLLGILIYAGNDIANWDCTEMKAKVESLGIDIPEHFERANKQYMEAVVNDAKNLPDGVAEVEWCATDEESRGKGVASTLFDEFLKLPQYHEQHLTVLADNPPAINLYKSKGFEIVSAQTGYPDDSVNTYNMVRKTTH